MNGFKSKAVLAGCLAACATVAGCHEYGSYNDIVDPCWPQRYNCMAREEVTAPLGTQAHNGLVLDQTVWNYHFAEGKFALNVMGQEHLARLARRRPGPVPEVYVQAAHDLAYDQGKPAEEFIKAKTELEGKRLKAVTDYLSVIRPEVPFKVAVHDPSPVGMSGVEASIAAQGHLRGAVGTVNGGNTATNEANRAGSQPDVNVNQTNRGGN